MIKQTTALLALMSAGIALGQTEPKAAGTGPNSTIGGGTGNTAGGAYSTVSGGGSNTAPGTSAVVAGGFANIAQHDAAVGGGYSNRATGSRTTVGGGTGNLASGDGDTISGGYYNWASGPKASIGGGQSNQSTGDYSTISGGRDNVASLDGSTVTGGASNVASGGYSVAGGAGNHATGSFSTAIGGWANLASNDGAAVTGGLFNKATGSGASVPGGRENEAAGNHSFAAGSRAKAWHGGSFVWSDDISQPLESTAANQFSARAIGGFRLVTNGPAVPTGVRLDPGGSQWLALSDRNSKTAFLPVDAKAVLRALVAIPVTTWSYKAQDAAIRHIGPMAQDFQKAFQVGEDREGKTIGHMDALGVAYAAIQGLHEELTARDGALAELRESNEELKRANTELHQRVEALEAAVSPQKR